jgi:hypothetical protein
MLALNHELLSGQSSRPLVAVDKTFSSGWGGIRSPSGLSFRTDAITASMVLISASSWATRCHGFERLGVFLVLGHATTT